MKEAVLRIFLVACAAVSVSVLSSTAMACDLEGFGENATDSAASEKGLPPLIEKYVFKTCYVCNWEEMELETVKECNHWIGSSSKTMSYTANKSPWVVNAYYQKTSQIASSFNVIVTKGREIWFAELHRSSGTYSILVEERGSFTVEVESSGCKWKVKVGVEPTQP